MAGAILLVVWPFGGTPSGGLARAVDPGPTQKATCGPGSNPETGTQGRVSAADVTSGRAAAGYTCNLTEISHFGTSGGYKVFRYIDGAGHECAFYDSTLLFPTGVPSAGADGPGVYVMDMTDPAHPVKTDNLVTPAMLSPHESLYLNQARGLLAADMGFPTFNPGFVDIYDVSVDCRHPVLKSSSPLGILGHESGFSPDGRTFWASSAGGQTLAALDITDPALPSLLWLGRDWSPHGVRVSKDGNRLYIADTGDGLHILDVSQIQARTANPVVTELSFLTWPELSIPQVAIPVTIGGHPYLIEIDEFAKGVSTDPAAAVGAARIIDIADDTKPAVVSNIRLEVHMPQARLGEQKDDPGPNSSVGPLQPYAGHYCEVPQADDPGIVACGMIVSGLRVFDIRDPLHPKELAYFNKPLEGTAPVDEASSYAMDAPTFVKERAEIWHADGNGGLSVLRFTNGVWPFATASAGTPQAAVTPRTPAIPSGQAAMPATGGPTGLAVRGVALLLLALLVRRARAAT
jgi:hypothetical protein